MIKVVLLNIVLTNDDGIHSPGLWQLADKLKLIGDLTVIVPDRDQSGMGASMTLLRPLTVNEVVPQVGGISKVYTVDGSPADCVIMADELLCDHKIDLLVSGINMGANLGLDIYNSGTFGAALHGYYRGIDSIAVSVEYIDDVIYKPSALVGASVALNLLGDTKKRSNLLINLNLPACDGIDIEGVNITTLGKKAYMESVEAQKHGRRTSYWLRHNNPALSDADEGSDIWAIENNRVSITIIDPMNVGNHLKKDSHNLVTSAVHSLTGDL